MRRPLASLIALSLILLGTGVVSGSSGPADAGDALFFDDGGVVIDDSHVHGDMAGRLDTSSSNVSLIGRGQVNNPVENRVSDVGVLGNFAYLGSFATTPCQGGVYVVDISDLSAPRQVGFIASAQGSFVGEGVHPIHFSTPAFTGDVLAFSNELCTAVRINSSRSLI